jgi:hypothetical protein
MKSVIIALLLFAVTAQSQVVQRVRPFVSTVTADSILVTLGSDTLFANRADIFDTANVVAGIRIQGKGIPFGSTVVSLTETGDTLIISADATATDTLVTVSLGYFAGSQAYQAGDALGWLFRMNNFKRIDNVVVVDDASQLATGVTLAVFSQEIIAAPDNLAFTPTDADADKLNAVFLLSVSNAWGANKVWSLPATTLPLPVKSGQGSSGLWGQLVSGGIGTYTAIDNLTVIITGE